MTELRQRDPRQEDAKHLAFVRTQPCCLPFCNREAEPAHLRMENLAIGKEMTGTREKPHDKYTVPLCPYHHRLGVDCQHNSNEREWWEMRGINPWAIAASLWIASGGAERATMPKPVCKPAPVKVRKPHELRAKIVSSHRTIPGRRFNGSAIPSRIARRLDHAERQQ
ncbi:hypothetical protein LPB73_07350 [Tardiphaga sp. 37S4]|uniref:DUF968 domain-containing protein n=1 Tax=Tardiphaga sp. 37S4 TaxID=1404741 RepID=UPI001E373A77|nr:hypothetical protein [Tardiphaga sp. 37S4]UFS77184.1 hypothetical protein LPB73_07350 [Tardiphaga sp. 37S4]